jgi:hypothetical protein
MLQGYYRRGEYRPVLTGRAARRAEMRAQARNAARTTGHHTLSHQQRALILVCNAGRMLVIDYLHGIGLPEAERYASAAGRKVAEVYRETHGSDPYAGCKVIVNGVVRSCMGYVTVEDLHRGALAYRRTAAFLAEQQAAVDTRTLVNA